MPELPEVERLRQSLEPHLLGRRVLRAQLLREDIWTPAAEAPRSPAAREVARQLLAGGRIARTARRGKQLAIIADDGRVLLVHLGMSGQMIFHAAASPADKPLSKTAQARRDRQATHVHARWSIGHARTGKLIGELVFRDPRRFGGLWSFRTVEDLQQRWQDLGPDALEITPAHLSSRLKASKRPIKAALLDQSVVAGVGNIYADESLFLSNIHPGRWCTTLTPREWKRLARAIPQVLQSSIAAGGSTLRDYVDANGRPGKAKERHWVYGRGSKPCLKCGRPLESSVVAQRTTVHCPGCQPWRSEPSTAQR